MTAQSIGKYQLIRKLATGGMAEVWLARQVGIEDFQRDVVVKRILPHLAEDVEFVQMFLNEAKIAARFSHPNIAQIYELGAEAGSYFIAMEYVHGEDLGRVMRKAWSSGQWLVKALAVRIVASACDGLFYAHTRSDESGRPLRVVHRDVSPQNILVSFDGGVKLVDFGIAKAADQASMTKSGAIKGKFAYMSPEQAAGKPLDHRSDIFALGLVLYELLTGVRPIKRETELATLQAALECKIEPPSAVSDCPPELDGMVMRALRKLPDDRYRDAREFQVALEETMVNQRWVATSVQVAELLRTLFADRLAEEAKEPSNPSKKKDPGKSRSPSEGAGAAADMDWEAPPGATELPKSAHRMAVQQRSQLARGPSRGAAGDSHEVETASLSPRKAPSHLMPSAMPPAALEEESTALADATQPKRVAETLDRPSTGFQPAGGAQTGEVTLPPPRLSPAAVPVLAPIDPAFEPTFSRSESGQEAPRYDTLDGEPLAGSPRRYLDLEKLWERARKAFQPLLYLGAALAAFGLVFLFRSTLTEVLFAEDSKAESIFLTVETTPRVQVYVRHAEHGPDAKLAQLGASPLRRVEGAHLGDTIILENRELGLHFEEALEFGQPGENKVISREFRTGHFRPELIPRNVTGLAFYLNEQEVGRYVANGTPSIQLVEGKHVLELRGPRLVEPKRVVVEIEPDTLVKKSIDVTSLLR
ncbi:MAG: protein kinase domain-containing protein [Myxococcaceae bacterium]